MLATIAWERPFQRTGMDAFGAVYEIPLEDDTKPVNFIMHLPSGDSVPDTREPGGDRSFVPLDHPQIWLKQGDPTVYFSSATVGNRRAWPRKSPNVKPVRSPRRPARASGSCRASARTSSSAACGST